MILYLLLRQHFTNLVERLHRLPSISNQEAGKHGTSVPHLVPHQRFFNHRKMLKGRKKHVRILGTANVLHEIAQLIGDRFQDFILILNRV